ncbi:MAG: amidohydrolase family protein, partial [Gemmatimonadota bacterium]|nr:amidohydrolase family protein [Gemmatimonadota bacterium]
AFVGANVVPMDEERVLEHQTVIVADDRIIRIGPAGEVDVPDAATVIDGSGLYLMPGLAEMHAHIPSARAPEEYLTNTLFLYVANGITTIRGMLGEASHLELRQASAADEILAPRIYTSGPSLNGNSVGSPAQADRMVREQKEAGYDFLKLHPGLTRANFDAIVEAADEVGIPFGGHVSLDVGLARTLEAGQATIDHLDGYVEELANSTPGEASQFFGLNLAEFADIGDMPRLARRTAEAGVWNVPTMALFPEFFGNPDDYLGRADVKYVSRQQAQGWAGNIRQRQSNPLFAPENGILLLELRRQILRELHEAGAGILLGSDAPQIFNVPGFSMHEELAEYVESGLSPFEALQTGTVNVARFYEALNERGTVAEGMIADLILVRGNPLQDVDNVRQPAGVMLRGRWIPANEIEERLEAIAEWYGD